MGSLSLPHVLQCCDVNDRDLIVHPQTGAQYILLPTARKNESTCPHLRDGTISVPFRVESGAILRAAPSKDLFMLTADWSHIDGEYHKAVSEEVHRVPLTIGVIQERLMSLARACATDIDALAPLRADASCSCPLPPYLLEVAATEVNVVSSQAAYVGPLDAPCPQPDDIPMPTGSLHSARQSGASMAPTSQPLHGGATSTSAPDASTKCVHSSFFCVLLPLLCRQLKKAECDNSEHARISRLPCYDLSPTECASRPVSGFILRLERLLRLHWLVLPPGFRAVSVGSLTCSIRSRLVCGRSLADLERGHYEGDDPDDPLVTGALDRSCQWRSGVGLCLRGFYRLFLPTSTPAGISCVRLPRGLTMRHPGDPAPARLRPPEPPPGAPPRLPLTLAEMTPSIRIRDAGLRKRDTVHVLTGLPPPSFSAPKAPAAASSAPKARSSSRSLEPGAPYLGPWGELPVRLMPRSLLEGYKPGRPPFVSLASEQRRRAKKAELEERAKRAELEERSRGQRPRSGGAPTASSHKTAAGAPEQAAAAVLRARGSSAAAAEGGGSKREKHGAYCDFCDKQTDDVVDVSGAGGTSSSLHSPHTHRRPSLFSTALAAGAGPTPLRSRETPTRHS